MKKTLDIKKLILLNMPYILLGLFATNFGEAWRMAQGADASEKFLSLVAVLPGALQSFWPSLHPLDLLVGLCCGVGLRLAVYLKSKNAKKYRHGLEYGSARWGTREDIAPYVDPVFQNNVILTKTESLTMNSRPKDPKTARNKNVLVIGGSGSGKTRFWLKPNLMQMHSSYVVTDPKGTILVECGKMLQRGAPKLGKDGKPLKYPALKPPDAKGYFRFHKLGEGYTLEEIRARILRNIHKQPPFPELVHHLPQHYRVRGKPQKKVTGLRALYFRYCYELHIIVKQPASVKRVSFLLREDIAKLDRLDAETRLLGKHHIGTIEELTTHRETALMEANALAAQRQELRKELRRCSRQGDAIAADEVKQRISALSDRIRAARKEVVLCDGIAQRSGQVRENLGRLVKQKEIERKEQLKNELFRRRGGASREDVAGNR